MRHTVEGGALTPGENGPVGATLALTMAARITSDPSRAGVPGTQSSSDSGTVPANRPAPRTVRASYTLVGPRTTDLSAHVGQWVEVTGTLEPVRTEPQPVGTAGRVGVTTEVGGRTETGRVATAHPSAPAERLTVASFRAVGGSCN